MGEDDVVREVVGSEGGGVLGFSLGENEDC